MKIRALLTLLFASAMLATSARAQDNVLLIIADDYGIDSSSLYNSTSGGASLPPTPTLAALASAGVRFSHAHAYPVCSPTRAAMLTGRYGFRTGVQNVVMAAAGNALTAAEFTLPEAFTAAPAAGYELASFGKWHLGASSNLLPATVGGWPFYSGFLGGAVTSFTSWTKVVTDGTGPGTSSSTSTGYQTSVTVDDTMAWIATQETAGAPWFAWVGFAAAHSPLHKPPSSLCPTYAGLPGTTAHINANPRLYYEAMVEALDTEIARLLAGVDLANTNVIFVGDNGTPGNVVQPPFTSGRAKGTLYEGGVRVPLIVSGPAVVAGGRVSAEPVHVVDLFATILELAGLDPAQVVPATTVIDSRSLAPILANQSSPRVRVFGELGPTSGTGQADRTLRDERYKLIDDATAADEFYDVSLDPNEATNLLLGALSAEQQARLDQLRTWLVSYADDTGVSICSADGALGSSSSGCPCANTGAVGHGCAHSFHAWGANLSASGATAADDVLLYATNLPSTSFTLFLQHETSGDQVFHDGVLCAGGALVRLRGRAASGGRASFPDPAWDSTLTLSQRGAVTVGSGTRRYYSAWYRNASTSYCPPATANVSNGWRLDW